MLFLHALNSPQFPHDGTINQFLGSREIRAYQLLGERSAEDALEHI